MFELTKTKTREGAKNTSRFASHHEIDKSTFNTLTSFGNANVDQLIDGILFPNVQAVVSDIVNGYQTPINGVALFADAASNPTAISMVEQLEITGIAEDNGLIYPYGVAVKVTKGDNQAAVTTKIINALKVYQAKGAIFSNVIATTGVNNKIDVTFADSNPHNNFSYIANGISIIGSTSTPAKPGYGSWSKIGEQDVTLGTVTNKIYYYKRTA